MIRSNGERNTHRDERSERRRILSGPDQIKRHNRRRTFPNPVRSISSQPYYFCQRYHAYSLLHQRVPNKHPNLVLLHIPRPTQRRHRLLHRRTRILRRERLRRRRQYPQPALLLHRRHPALHLPQQARRPERQVRQGAVHQADRRELRDVHRRVAEEALPAVDGADAGVAGGDGEAAAESADGGDGGVDPGDVEDGGDVLDALVEGPDEVAFGAFEG